MSGHSLAIVTLLSITVLACLIGVLGMWWMRTPVQALHYLTLPGTVGAVSLALAVFLQTGFSSAAVKSAVIAAVLVSINAVVAHATARAIFLRSKNRGRHGLPDWNLSREDQA